MNKRFNIPLLAAMGMFFLIITGCSKNNPYETVLPPVGVHFTGTALQNYTVDVPNPPDYVITLGTTDVSGTDRTVTFKVASPTGATAGVQYTLSASGNTVTIPAGQTSATITVKGLFAGYDGQGRKDTLIFTLAEPSIKPADFQDTLYLAMRGPCFEGDVDPDALKGTYANTIETFGTGAPYGPYTTTISAATLITPTTANITVTNLWDFGWNPIQFTLDWTDPNNRKVTLQEQSGIADAGTINSAYAGEDVSVRPNPDGSVGTFSACNGTLTLRLQLGVTGLGWFNNSPFYVVNMAR